MTTAPHPSAASARDDERAPIARAHAHALARPHVQPRELEPQGLDLAPERLVIQRPGGINDRRPLRPLPGGLSKGIENVHWFICFRIVSTASSTGRPIAWNAAAVPAAQPVAKAVPMTRAEVIAPASAEKQRPAASTLSNSTGRRQSSGITRNSHLSPLVRK